MAPGDACHECRKGQERSLGCRGGLPPPRRSRRSRRRHRGGGEKEDRISSLPDDLLLQILARLRSARAAALTGLLARRWRGLWTRLPELTFHNTTPDRLHAALAQAASPVLSLLEIRVSSHHTSEFTWAAPLLSTAARLAPKKLNIVIEHDWRHPYFAGAVQLPCFDRTISICLENLHMIDLRFALPPAGCFQALECLTLASCLIDLAALLPLCPHLRKLRICNSELDSLTVHSPFLEELDVKLERVKRIDILTPLLKKLKFFGRCDDLCCLMLTTNVDECSFTYSAPVVEELSWEYQSPASINWFGMDWLLDSLKLQPLQPLQHWPRDHILSLKVEIDVRLFTGMWTFEEAISSQIPVTRFSILKLDFICKGHVYGPMVLFLLGICTLIQTLELKLSQVENEECVVNCLCDQPNNWRSQNLSLTNLKEVDIQGFKGDDHEIDLLKVIFRSATMLERVTVKLSSKVSSRDRYIGIQSILEAHPSIECKIYRDSGACLVCNLRNASWSIGLEISRHSDTHFSILELEIVTEGYIYGAVVLHLLGLSTSIQRLEVKLSEVVDFEACSVNCPCDQPNNWRSQNVPLTHLKEVEIEDIKGEGHEIDLLKAILRNATMLERMTVKFSYVVSQSGSCCKRIQRVFKAYPSVECSFYL
ncbi:hypothetical protein EJB05_12608, partial [Eragrostis curvula]